MARANRQELSENEQSEHGGTAAAVPPSVVIAYGSTFGTTEAVARRLAATLETRLGRPPTLADIGWTELSEIVAHDVLILGSSTWDHGFLQPDWEAVVDLFGAQDLRGRRVAVFGCGDLAGYPDTFGDALGILRERAIGAGAEPFGRMAASELGFAVADLSGSQAVDGEYLAGLLLDDAEDDETRDARTDAWAAQLAREIAKLVALRALLAGLCPVDDPVATLDDVVEHVRDEMLSRNGDEKSAAKESLSTP